MKENKKENKFKDIDRWEPNVYSSYGQAIMEWEKDSSGEWVKFKDIEAFLKSDK